MSNVKLQWAGAAVEDAKLTVALDGELPKGWKHSFERTVQLLGDGDWGKIQLKKSTVRVTDVALGSEDKLRHHLEAIVAQANATLEEDEEDNDGGSDGAEPEGPDAEMTGRFRAFAEDDDEADEADEDA
jgi:hypothetical protein